MAVNGFAGKEHSAKNGEGVREETERRVGSNESVEKVSGFASGKGEKNVGLVQLRTGGIGGDELGSDEVVG